MASERIHVWAGNFERSDAPDYFVETFSEDDIPLSPFVRDQGKVFVDHDWMEKSWLDKAVDVADLLSPHMFQADERDRAVSIAHEMGLQKAFLVVTIDEDEVTEPRSVEQPPLIYLGCFGNIYIPPGPDHYMAAAQAGDSRAQATLGEMYIFPPPEHSKMIDIEKAEYWLLKAAEKGEVSTYNRLYHIYSGKYGKANPEKAFYFSQKAAELGSATDFSYLSAMFANGIGTPRDDVQALTYKFLQLCRYHSDSHDKPFKELAARMSDADIAEAEKRALAWIETNGESAPRFRGFARNPVTNLTK